MVNFFDNEFEKRLVKLTNAANAIQSLSNWCMARYKNRLDIVSVWLSVIQKIKIEKRLYLFYLANDVIQRSKNTKYYMFADEWAPFIVKAIPYVKDEQIQSKISRIIKIWKERLIYDDSYLANLNVLLTSPIQKQECTVPDQQVLVNELSAKICNYLKSKKITELNMNNLRNVHLPLNSDEVAQDILKDSTRIDQILNEMIDVEAKIENCIKSLQNEKFLRAQLLNTLKVAKSYNDKKNEVINKIIVEMYYSYFVQSKLQNSNIETSVNSMCTDNPMSSSDINIESQSLSASSVSVENLSLKNMSCGKNLINSPMENNKNTNIIVPITNQNHINYRTKSTITSDSCDTIQASVSVLAVENEQALTNQFLYHAPSQSPNETLAFSQIFNQTNASDSNEMYIQSISTNNSTNDFKSCVPTSMPFSQQYTTSKLLNSLSSNSSSLVNENPIRMAHFQQTAWNETMNNCSTNDSALTSVQEKMPYQDISIILCEKGNQWKQNLNNLNPVHDQLPYKRPHVHDPTKKKVVSKLKRSNINCTTSLRNFN